MIYLKTRLETLERGPTIRIANHALRWCRDNLGVNNRKKYLPTWSVTKGFDPDLVGEYDHEMNENVKVRTEPAGFRGVEKIVSSKDKAAVEQAVAQIEREYPSAGYGTNVKKMYQTPSGVWVAVVRHSTTSD